MHNLDLQKATLPGTENKFKPENKFYPRIS